MIVNTKRLFLKLLPRLEIGVVCDIGSLDCSDALAFRRAVPLAAVYAFEANPLNLDKIANDFSVQQGDIHVVSKAVTNYEGVANFFLVNADYTRADYRRGMSSLYQRPENWLSAAVVPVSTTRLDTYLADEAANNARFALWIDVEGKAYEVIDGMSGIAERVCLLHVEVETSPCIGYEQRLYSDVKALLQRSGFTELATDQSQQELQFNALFIRSNMSAANKWQVRAWLAEASLRRFLVRLTRRIWPSRLHRHQNAPSQPR
jgi:FkbM family methyltransferase